MTRKPDTATSEPHRHVLADFQMDAVVSMQGVAQRAVSQQVRAPAQRGEIARHGGVMLLQSPTASGKTLMLGRTLEGLVGKLPRKTVWFWFAPFAGLVSQTVEALAEQCPGLRLRDATRDREPGLARDGDVFVSTWGAVAANNAEARTVRRTTESTYSLDQMLELLRLDDFAIGVVIDEAHLNFGSAAKAAATFYLEHLRPDVTILATATPNDDKLEHFASEAGVQVGSRIEVSRSQVVERGLNKWGLMVGVMRLREQDKALVDPETSALSCGWHQHLRIRDRLEERGLGVTPLMLVQVEDQGRGDADPIARVKEKLISIGVPESVIATHTSGNPDPDFHTLAFDPSREVLIFKVAVATGFDAPRAWTLVSVRPSRGKDFGLQIVGRIMRVHPAVRPFHGQDALLDRGYVFLTDPELQSGLQEAASVLDSVTASIDVITSNFDLIELGTAPRALAEAAGLFRHRAMPPPPRDDAERQARLDILIGEQRVPLDIRNRPTEEIDRAIQVAEQMRDVEDLDLFGGTLPQQDAPGLFGGAPRSLHMKQRAYPLRAGLDVPDALIAELPPKPEVLNSDDFNRDLARRYINGSRILQQVNAGMGAASVELRDLFHDDVVEMLEDVQIRLDDGRIQREGQKAFDFNTAINQRLLKGMLREEVRKAAVRSGLRFTDLDISRAIYLAAMREPHVLKDAMKEAKAAFVETGDAEPVPKVHHDYDDCPRSRLNAYGVMPSDLNRPERAFAEWLDGDGSGRVKWWLRNPSRAGWQRGWGTNLILPDGGFFFPDFVVSIRGRATPNEIVLVEVKGTHNDNTDESLEKIRVRHRRYDAVRWVQQRDDLLLRLQYDGAVNRVLTGRSIDIDSLLYAG